jgi:transposase InsO family protein
MAARFGFAEDAVRLAAALRPALASRGVPEHVYVDNGSAFVDAWLLRACASLGIKLVHSQPGRPLLTGQSQPPESTQHAGELRILARGRDGCRNVRRHE